MGETEPSSSSTNTARKKISLQQHQADEIEQLADQYQSGNLSALVREAIRFYDRRMGDPGGLPLTRQLQTAIEDITERLDDIEDQLEELDQQAHHRSYYPRHADDARDGSSTEQVPEPTISDTETTDEVSKQQGAIETFLQDASPDSCSIATISDQTGIPAEQVAVVLGRLVQQDVATLVESSHDHPEYRYATDDTVEDWIETTDNND